jgi:hypothetical protein
MIRLTLTMVAALAFVAGCGIGDAQQRLRSAVDAKQDELDRCYTTALTRNENIGGEVDATLVVDEGQITEVDYGGGQVTDPQLRGCMADVLRGVRLEEPPKPQLRVDYTFRLTASD